MCIRDSYCIGIFATVCWFVSSSDVPPTDRSHLFSGCSVIAMFFLFVFSFCLRPMSTVCCTFWALGLYPLPSTKLLYGESKEVSVVHPLKQRGVRCDDVRVTTTLPTMIPSAAPPFSAEASFGSVDPTSLWWPGRNAHGMRRLHHREVFASKVDGVLAMRLTCEEEDGGRGCLRRV